MCGRFVSSSSAQDISQHFDVDQVSEQALEHRANFNTAPTTDVFVVFSDGSERKLDTFHWGLVPRWAKDIKIGSRLINARAETVADKPSFRSAFKKRRCIMPADGFYEWNKPEGAKRKQPWYIHDPDGEPYAFAGLWEEWKGTLPSAGGEGGKAVGGKAVGGKAVGGKAESNAGEKDGRAADDAHEGTDSARGGEASGDDGAPVGEEVTLRSSTIITGEANEKMAELHNRMPMILPASAWDEWLDPATDPARVKALLVPAPKRLITFHPVSTEVNNVRNKGEHLVDEVDLESPGTQGALDTGGH